MILQEASTAARGRRDEPRVLLWYAALARAKAVASCRYRIGNLAEAGRGATVVIAEELPPGALEAIDALFILRPYPSRAVHRALDQAARRGVLRVADYDDLLFAGDASERPEVVSGRLPRGWMERAHRAYAGLLPAFDAFSVATEELAQELRALRGGAPVWVVPNGLSESWVAQGRALYPRWQPGDRRVMRFFPGSPTHDASFAEICGALAAWMRTRDDVHLEVVGNLDWDPSGFPRGRARRVGAVPFDHLPALLASSWVSLWPRAETRFNRCKSPIKLLEAAAFGCPTVASSACRRDGLDGDGIAYAASPEAWGEALDRLRDDVWRMKASAACSRLADERGGADRGWAALRAGVDAARGGRA